MGRSNFIFLLQQILLCAFIYFSSGCKQKLHRLEVAAMEYRESLEERGTKSSEEMDKKVAPLKKKQEVDYGFVDGQWLSSQD